MMIVLLGLLAFSQSQDTNIYLGMDVNIGQFSRYWDKVYETSPSGFRTSQGCHDMKLWYQLYEAKIEADFNRTFSLRYQFYMVRDYDVAITRHRFEPTMRIWRDLYAHLVIVPAFYKKDDEVGVGMAWRRGSTDWLAFYAIAQAFDHNFSLMYTPEGPDNDPFRRIPFKFELDARGELRWARLRFHAELGTRSAQYLCWPDSIQYVWDRDQDRSLAWGRLELRPVRNLWLGARFGWSGDRSQTLWPGREGRDTLTADTLLEFWAEPFISLFPTERLELRLQHRIWDTRRDMDSLTYFRDYDVLSTVASWHPLPVLLIEAGYQRSWRYRYNNDTLIPEPWSGRHSQSRLLFNLELRLRSGMMLTIKEGLEMDFFPRGLFRSPHNHTYISIYMPLAFVRKHGRSKDKQVKALEDSQASAPSRGE